MLIHTKNLLRQLLSGISLFLLAHTASAAPEAVLIDFWLANDESNTSTIDHQPWQDFLEQYPEHSDLMVGIACVFGDQRTGSREEDREHIAKWVRDEALAEIMDGFTKSISDAHLHTEVSLKQQ